MQAKTFALLATAVIAGAANAQAVRSAFRLDSLLPSDERVAETPLAPLRRTLRDALEHAKEAWNRFAAGAAIGLPHEMKGTGIHTYVLLKAGASGDKHLESELKEHVARELGRIATPETVHFVEALPKTRSGKIMRRVLRARALGQDEGDLSTLEE